MQACEGQAGGLRAYFPEKGKNASELICFPPVGTKLNVGLGGAPTLVWRHWEAPLLAGTICWPLWILEEQLRLTKKLG